MGTVYIEHKLLKIQTGEKITSWPLHGKARRKVQFGTTEKQVQLTCRVLDLNLRLPVLKYSEHPSSRVKKKK